jgi:hypothetical protein
MLAQLLALKNLAPSRVMFISASPCSQYLFRQPSLVASMYVRSASASAEASCTSVDVRSRREPATTLRESGVIPSVLAALMKYSFSKNVNGTQPVMQAIRMLWTKAACWVEFGVKLSNVVLLELADGVADDVQAAVGGAGAEANAISAPEDGCSKRQL